MGSTKIDPEQTVGEIMKLLSKHNIRRIMTAYENGEIVGFTFSIAHGADELPFKLPVRWEPVLRYMMDDRHTPGHLCRNEQAKRVAWRLIFRWIEAQLALVEINMADIKEIFMPYLITSEGKTLYQVMEARSFPELLQRNKP
jgi:hypothetical protein